MKKKISIITACYNEELNIEAVHEAIKRVMTALPMYDYEHVFADNCSTDATPSLLEKIAANDKHVKVIFNLNNYGPSRSGANALFRTTGDAIIGMPCDLQEPPEMIPLFLDKWEEGHKVVWGQRTNIRTGGFFIGICRKTYYKMIMAMSESEEIEGCTGYGVLDREVADHLKWIGDPEPFFRNAITAIGYKPFLIPYEQKPRRSGQSNYNFFRYLNTAMTSLIATTKLPLRFATFLGLLTAAGSFTAGLTYLVMKLIHWETFNAGVAPLVVGLFFLGGVQLICVGIVGEYVGAVLTRVKRRPLVIERKSINFDADRSLQGAVNDGEALR
jgi:glycosyltransferase involved in cell wall biosynthesis